MAAISIRVRRCFALALCVVFILLVVLAPTAKAVFAELVLGGVVASGAGAAIALGATVLLITMTVSGLRDAANNAAESAGMDTKTWLKGKVQDFVSYSGTAVETVLKGLGYTADGKITISQALGNWAAGCMNWLLRTNAISPSSGVNPDGNYSVVSTTYGDVYVIGNGTYRLGEGQVLDVTGSDIFSYVWKNSQGVNYYLCFVSDNSFSIVSRAVDSNGNTTATSAWSTSSDTLYYYVRRVGAAVSFNDWFPSITGMTNSLPSAADWQSWKDSYAGVEEGYDVGIWENEDADAGYVLDPTGVLGLEGSIPLDPALDGSMVDINDYLDVLSDALAGDDPISLDLVGGQVLPLPGVVTDDPSIPLTVPDTVIDDSYPATGENTPDNVPYTGTGEYSLNLTNFFPFCIPFDIYRMLRLFDSQAEAPEITIPIVVDSLGISEEVSIDLSAFDSVAQILRTAELIAFCVGLAFVTKKLIQGG